jgi:hypothetical protein
MQNDNQVTSEELAVIPRDSVQLGTLRVDSPTSVVDIATQIANKLTDVINQKKLYFNIGQKRYPLCEAWTTCAAMLGISPKEAGVMLNEDGDYVAVVELIDSQGQVVGGASASCGMDEPRWAAQPRYARRSMAVTRATSKACRLKFSWIMTLAGFEATPAEEMAFIPNINEEATKRQERREQESEETREKRAAGLFVDDDPMRDVNLELQMTGKKKGPKRA